ncbi:hypothetical protein BST63_02840 [Bradyrhizobium canariense]|uniref:Uncharacterized protein n=1 Tax=Bradyrhizobium canariense TaxID=255045 RepID=A0ABX3XB58_9BRAD|nr:hypothetical protein BSR47_02875 [Bradyrhizobium canariense]OSJ34908.1 hypothetical protein BST63_02840 [Bradyrhizobium canariense]
MTPLRRMRAITQEPPPFRLSASAVLLKREVYLTNHKKPFRLYREEKLAVSAAAAASARSGPELR